MVVDASLGSKFPKTGNPRQEYLGKIRSAELLKPGWLDFSAQKAEYRVWR
jgi:hypothetical protein